MSLSARANHLYTQEEATRPPRKAGGKNANADKRRAAKAEAIIGPPLQQADVYLAPAKGAYPPSVIAAITHKGGPNDSVAVVRSQDKRGPIVHNVQKLPHVNASAFINGHVFHNSKVGYPVFGVF